MNCRLVEQIRKMLLWLQRKTFCYIFAQLVGWKMLMWKERHHIWSNVVLIVEYWKFCPLYKQPGKGDPKSNKTYEVLLQNHTNLLVPLYFQLFETVATKLDRFLRQDF